MAEDMEEVKKSLNIMSQELSALVKQKNLAKLIEEVRQLRDTIKEKDKKIEELQKRVDDLEQYAWMDDLLITGLVTRDRTYARTTAGDKEGEDAPLGEVHTLEQQVINFFNSKDIPLQSENISACHTIPHKQGISPKIILRFVNRKHKVEVLKLTTNLKGSGCM